MALDLGDIGEFFDPSMTFTLRGKEYRIPPVSAALGLWGRRVAALGFSLAASATPEERTALLEQAQDEVGAPPVPGDQTQTEALLSSELVAELVADGVDDPTVQHLAGVAFARLIGGDKMAVATFRGEAGPNRQSPANRQERRAAAKATKQAAPTASGSLTTSTAKANTTRKPASGSGMKSPTKSAAKRAASRGGKS